MIEPLEQGPELIEEILETHPFHGSLATWWLGQSGFLIKTDGGILVIDRMTRASPRGADLGTIDLVLASHKHSDHLDPETLTGLLAASADARLARRRKA